MQQIHSHLKPSHLTMLDFRIKPSTAAPARPPAASKHQCVALYPKLKGALVKLRFGASDNPLYLCLITYLFVCYTVFRGPIVVTFQRSSPGGNVTMSFFFMQHPVTPNHQYWVRCAVSCWDIYGRLDFTNIVHYHPYYVP